MSCSAVNRDEVAGSCVPLFPVPFHKLALPLAVQLWYNVGCDHTVLGRREVGAATACFCQLCKNEGVCTQFGLDLENRNLPERKRGKSLPRVLSSVLHLFADVHNAS